MWRHLWSSGLIRNHLESCGIVCRRRILPFGRQPCTQSVMFTFTGLKSGEDAGLDCLESPSTNTLACRTPIDAGKRDECHKSLSDAFACAARRLHAVSEQVPQAPPAKYEVATQGYQVSVYRYTRKAERQNEVTHVGISTALAKPQLAAQSQRSGQRHRLQLWQLQSRS